MSIGLVKEQIHTFLKSKEPEVLAIKGRWGIGKTYTWDKYVKEIKDDIEFKSYAYVSLFGLNSLNELKRAIFENTIDTKIIGQKPDVFTFKKNYLSLVKQLSRKSAGFIKGVAKPMANAVLKGSGSGLEEAFSSLSFMSLNKTVICFDDIERHSESLKLKDFLGLVSFLKEQKDCKVVILLNEDAKDLQDYFTYKEKVIDKQLHFEPSALECFELAIENQDQYLHIRDCCLKLDIKNIRVLKKIERHSQEVLSLICDYHDDIKYQIVHSVVVFSWCYYCKGEDVSIPCFNFVKQSGIRKSGGNVDETKAKEWNATLSSYKYMLTDELDLVIAESIEQGFIHKEKLIALCDARQFELMAQERSEEYSKAWGVFHGSFNDNADVVVNAMEAGLRASVTDLSTSQYSKGIELIRDLGFCNKANELTEFYIEKMEGKHEKFNMKSMEYHPFGVDGEEFRNRLQMAYENLKKVDAPMDILDRWKGKSSYNTVDAETLGKLNKEELKAMFKGFEGKDLTDYIRVCLLLGNSSPELMKNTREALVEIGNESPLNKQRLSKFGL
ncbi:P-loop NTPase fold protein [Colwellia piezophila]|uniref:P-loop NTPase fold protein n=1 Tax=Colwellia piezophila TaxID=211668 RepID=UPI0003656D86|nr:P-loop NTPase fold protein [Colwellia piezophila]